MNRKAIQLATSTLILIVIGILLLIGIAYALTDGFKSFKSTTDLYKDSAEASAIKQTCTQNCENDNKIIYCCDEYDLGDKKIKCTDPKLELPCTLDCSTYSCE